MITVMRRYRRVLQVGLLGVIAAFVLTSVYIGSMSGGSRARADAVATVNGEAIPVERYRRAFQSYVNQMTQYSRQPLTPELIEQLRIADNVRDALVAEEIVVQRARAEGLAASDEEVNAYVHTMRAFQEDGRFTRRQFERTLQRAGFSEKDYVEEVRRQLTYQKAYGVIRAGIKVSDPELERAFTLRREEVRAAWALVETAPLMASAAATDEEVAAYLKTHSAEFQLPERRRVQYVMLAPTDFRPQVSEAEVEKYYTEHAREFETPQQVHAAHVLVPVPQTGGSEAEDKARDKIADVIRRAKAGEDFARLAAQISEDPGTKTKGGDLGWITKGEMVPAFETAVFALGPGQISSEPVRTPFGFHAIKVLEMRAASKKPLKEVAASIRDRLAAEAADRAARAKADEVKAPLQATKDFMAEAKRLGLTPIETTMSKLERMPMFGGADPLQDTAFTLAVGGVSSAVKTPAGWVILKSVEAIPAGVPPLAEIRDKVTTAVKRQKAEGVALDRATKLASDAHTRDFAAVAKAAGAQTGETVRFSRTKPAERLPGDVQLAALQSAAGTITSPLKSPQGYYVLKVLERVAPNMADLAAERDKLSRDVLTQKQSQAWEAWVAQGRSTAKIEMMALPRRS
jgi:peptidyl-prolyl cis-trans isomerase D